MTMLHSPPEPYSASVSRPVTYGPIDEERTISPLALLNVLLRRMRIVLLVAVLATLGTLGVALARGKLWNASSVFRPQAPSGGEAAGLASIAAQFGVSVGSKGGESLDLYGQILTSRELLRGVATERFVFVADPASPSDSMRGTPLELLKVGGETEGERMRRAVEALRRMVNVKTDAKAGTVTLTTTSRWSGLAEAVNRSLLSRLAQFNVRNRQSAARAERVFVEERLAQARAELAGAEARLQGFLDQNRVYQSAPRLVVEYSRLQRQVDLRQQVVSSLAQAHEKARIEEIRDTPVFTIVDSPEHSATSARSRMMMVLAGVFGGLFLGMVVAFIAEFLARQRDAFPADFAEFRALRRGALRGLASGRPHGS